MQVLRIRVAALGPKDLLVAATLNHLAALYFEQGKYAAVEPLYELVLGILRTALGLEHPSTTYPLNGLANLYRRQGRYVEAGPLFQQALAIWEAIVGPEHPNVATLSTIRRLSIKSRGDTRRRSGCTSGRWGMLGSNIGIRAS